MVHCSKCGETLIEIKRKNIKYDVETGEPITLFIMRCPNKKWYNNHDAGNYIASSQFMQYME